MTDLAVGRDGCFGCQLQCRHRFVIKDGTHAGTFGHSPELHALHAWAQVSCDLKTVLIANHLAASWGLDSAETARLVSWARQLYDEGIISAKDTDGLDLSSEGEEIVLGMVRLIARRQGVGASLSEGHAAALRRIGKGAQKVAFPLDSRVPGLENVSDPEKEVVAMSADMLGLCHIATAVYSDQASGLAEFSRMVGLNSGIEISADEMRESAMRAIALRVQMSDARSSENASVRAI
jgi:aldehyde:ferredoxin oxidoreductase